MSSPKRFTKGVTNVPSNDPLGQYLAPDPTKFHTWFDDFDHYDLADWVITNTGAGTEVTQSEDGGVLLLTNAAGIDDLTFLQYTGGTSATVVETFLMEAGKKAWFKTRVKISDATQSEFVVGLQITDTTPLGVTDGIFFRKDDGDTNIDIVVQESATALSTAEAIAAATTGYVELAWYYDGVRTLHYFTDGVERGTLTTTNVLPSTELTISFGIQNGEAVAKTMSVDYIFVSKER